MKTKRRHNRRRKRRRTRRHRRRRTRRRKTRRRRGAGNGMTSGEAALVARPEFKKIANAVILKSLSYKKIIEARHILNSYKVIRYRFVI